MQWSPHRLTNPSTVVNPIFKRAARGEWNRYVKFIWHFSEWVIGMKVWTVQRNAKCDDKDSRHTHHLYPSRGQNAGPNSTWTKEFTDYCGQAGWVEDYIGHQFIQKPRDWNTNHSWSKQISDVWLKQRSECVSTYGSQMLNAANQNDR
jgi:hypothetical protein